MKKTNIIKTIAFLLSMLMLWQGVVWADPGIFEKNTLQPLTLFTRPALEMKDTFLMLASGYLRKWFVGIENDPKNQNVPRIEKIIESALKEINTQDTLSPEFRKAIPKDVRVVSYDRSIIIDLGTCKIRYYNHNVPFLEAYGIEDPGEKYNVVEETIGKYLTRQILTQKALESRENPKEVLWYQNEVDFTLPNDLIEKELRWIRENAPEIQKKLEKDVEDFVSLGPWWLEQFYISVKKQIEVLDVFEKAVRDPDMTPEKLLEHILEFYATSEKDPEDTFGKLKFFVEQTNLEKFKDILKKIFSNEAKNRINKAPVRYAAGIFNKITSLSLFLAKNHRVASFVLNYILVKTGKPYFFTTRENVVGYYKLFLPFVSEDEKIKEKIEFFRKEMKKIKNMAEVAKEGWLGKHSMTKTFDDASSIAPEKTYEEETSWTGEKIVKNAEWAVPQLVEAFMEAAANVDEGKVVLMIDTDLAGINEKNAAEKVNDIVKLFARINSRRENKILNRFLKDLEVIADSGEELAERARNITGAGKIFPKNIIAITTSSNSEKLSDLAGINVTAIDDKGFEKDDYLPLTEVMLFTFGKYLKWDKEMLLMCYNLIPTAVSIDKLDEEEREALLTDTITSVIIHLIPNAIEFEEGELVGTYARIEMIVQNA